MRRIPNIRFVTDNKEWLSFDKATRLVILAQNANEAFAKYANDPNNRYVECCLVPEEYVTFVNDNVGISLSDVILIVYAAPRLLNLGVWSEAATYRYEAGEIDNAIRSFRNRNLVLDGINIANAFEDDLCENWSSYSEELADAFTRDPEGAKASLRSWFTRSRDPEEEAPTVTPVSLPGDPEPKDYVGSSGSDTPF